MKCKVVILGADGEAAESLGDLTLTDRGFDLKYCIAGDNCFMSSKGGTLTQSRRGNLDTDITFVKGKNTVCMLLSGELTGDIPVKTTALEVERLQNGVKVNIDYYLGGALINLRLSALYV